MSRINSYNHFHHSTLLLAGSKGQTYFEFKMFQVVIFDLHLKLPLKRVSKCLNSIQLCLKLKTLCFVLEMLSELLKHPVLYAKEIFGTQNRAF